jgi:hypothetical protein
MPTKQAVFVEEPFVDIDVVIVLPLPNCDFLARCIAAMKQPCTIFVALTIRAQFHEAMRHCNRLPAIIARISWRFNHLEPLMRASFTVAIHPILLHPHRAWKHEVGEFGGCSGIHIADDEELVRKILLLEKVASEVRQCLSRIGDLHPDRGDVAALISRRVEAFEEFHGVEARLGFNAARSQIPVFFGVLSMFWICNNEATRK